MPDQLDQQAIDQLSRIAEANGWHMIITDKAGPTLRVTFERMKTPDNQLARYTSGR